MIITNNYVTFEQAKALKELGFPQYENQERIARGLEEKIDIPNLYLVQKWLREEKNIHISIDITSSSWYQIVLLNISNGFLIDDTLPSFKSYEEALSAGIDKCIELLKETKE